MSLHFTNQEEFEKAESFALDIYGESIKFDAMDVNQGTVGLGAVVTAEISKIGKLTSADACTRLFMFSNGVSGLQITLTNVSEHLNIDFLVFLMSPL